MPPPNAAAAAHYFVQSHVTGTHRDATVDRLMKTNEPTGGLLYPYFRTVSSSQRRWRNKPPLVCRSQSLEFALVSSPNAWALNFSPNRIRTHSPPKKLLLQRCFSHAIVKSRRRVKRQQHKMSHERGQRTPSKDAAANSPTKKKMEYMTGVMPPGIKHKLLLPPRTPPCLPLNLCAWCRHHSVPGA